MPESSLSGGNSTKFGILDRHAQSRCKRDLGRLDSFASAVPLEIHFCAKGQRRRTSKTHLEPLFTISVG